MCGERAWPRRPRLPPDGALIAGSTSSPSPVRQKVTVSCPAHRALTPSSTPSSRKVPNVYARSRRRAGRAAHPRGCACRHPRRIDPGRASRWRDTRARTASRGAPWPPCRWKRMVAASPAPCAGWQPGACGSRRRCGTSRGGGHAHSVGSSGQCIAPFSRTRPRQRKKLTGRADVSGGRRGGRTQTSRPPAVADAWRQKRRMSDTGHVSRAHVQYT